jgi:cell division protein FtsZ
LQDVSIKGAKGLLINITGGPDLTLYEVNEAATLIQEQSHEDADIIFGAVINDAMNDEIRVTVIAAGFNNGAEEVKCGTMDVSSLATALKKIRKEDYDIPAYIRRDYADGEVIRLDKIFPEDDDQYDIPAFARR